MKDSFEDFASKMEAYIKWNKGYNIEKILRKIYIKYVYKGNTTKQDFEILYNNIESSINLASSESELEEIAGYVDDLFENGKISDKEHNYLVNKINEKWRKFW